MAGVNPFLRYRDRPGSGVAHICLLSPSTPSYKELHYTYPLKLITSSPHLLHHEAEESSKINRIISELDSVPLLFMLSYGGGLLPGDSIDFEVRLEPSTRLTIATQGSTKVFPFSQNRLAAKAFHPSCARGSSQHLNVSLGSNSALLLSPDPVQPFRDSHYSQTQIFNLDTHASLGILDWITSGRPAREEVWDAGSWTGRNEIWQLAHNDRGRDAKDSFIKHLILRDALYLEGGPRTTSMQSLKIERKGVFGTILLLGPIFENLSAFVLSEFKTQPKMGGFKWDEDTPRQHTMDSSNEVRRKCLVEEWRKERLSREARYGVLWTASLVRGVTVVKFAAEEVEGAKIWLNDILTYEGTVEREFGPGGLLGVR